MTKQTIPEDVLFNDGDESCAHCDKKIENDDGDWINDERTNNENEFWCEDCNNEL